MNCPNCGCENNPDAKFCKQCGKPLKESNVITHKTKKDDKNNKILIGAIAIVVIILAAIGLYATGVFNPGLSLENKDFDYFSLDVPVGSDFQLTNGAAKDNDHIAIMYENKGDHSNEINTIAFGKGIDDAVKGLTPSEVDGDMEIYKKTEDGKYDGLLYEKDGYKLLIMGNDINTMKKMAQSFEVGDVDNFKYDNDESSDAVPATTQTTSISKPASSDMNIIGGSFSTGGGLEDKTYAKIFVGSQYSGENVIIQIFYSRDGSDLNNGNMVPKTVSSDGYIEVSSADSFKYFPDHADINLYDSNGGLLDTMSVNLNPSSGTQTF